MRSAGILLPLFSLPSSYGIGTMGQAARDFIQFLQQSGQRYWQVLPIGPTGYGDSPYQLFSSFAGNPYFIDLDDLASERLLRPEEYQTLDCGSPHQVNYALLSQTRLPVLRIAVHRLLSAPPADYSQFLQDNAFWLEDYVLFMSLKGRHGGAPWYQWPSEERLRTGKHLTEEMDFWSGVQYLFFRQWHKLKQLANQSGVSIIGDLPIYVAHDSADVWAHPRQFQLDRNLNPIEVAGCPPDAFSKDGQLWGNPLFDWTAMKQDGYVWWLRRIAFQFQLFDMLRIDHFRGFDQYYAIPYGASTARSGRWRPGPGLAFFQAIQRELGPKPIIAEDLGLLTPSVRQLLQDTGYPGMKVLEFAFDNPGQENEYLPHRYERNCVVYTGTHDNETVLGWLATAPAPVAAHAKRYLRLNAREGYAWGMMRGAWSSVADLAIIPMQDLLSLGSEGRINTPSTVGNNWRWRLLPGQASAQLSRRLLRATRLYGRLPQPEPST